MSADNNDFVQSITPIAIDDSEESVLDTLLDEYKHVIFSSIITSFHLDSFIKDQYGGDVDTIHNVRKIGTDPQMDYKKKAHADAYAGRGKYSHEMVQKPGSNYQRMRKAARDAFREDPRNNTVQDAYEDKPLGLYGKSKGRPMDKNAEIDHVIAGRAIFDDRGRVLAGIPVCDLADDETNLRWTNESLNIDMSQQENPDYIAAHPELPEDVKQRMMEAYETAKVAYEDKVNRAFYFDFSNPYCREFYKDAAVAAGKSGIEMGIRQAIGFLLTDLFFSVEDAIADSDGSLEGVLEAIPIGLQRGVEHAKDNYPDLFAAFGKGVLAGVLDSITSTLLNTFVTTSQDTERMLRQAWGSIVEATSILLFNDKDQYLCDRMTSAAKVLATGASVIVGSSVQAKVDAALAGIAIPAPLKDTISRFAGSLCSGLLTVSLLFYIDNGPFTRFLLGVYGQVNRNLEEQGRMFREYCAELQQIDTERMTYESNYVYDLSLALSMATDQQEINRLLTRAVDDLNLPSLFGDVSLDDCMKKNDWVLTF